jgi:hypothetical protein
LVEVDEVDEVDEEVDEVDEVDEADELEPEGVSSIVGWLAMVLIKTIKLLLPQY